MTKSSKKVKTGKEVMDEAKAKTQASSTSETKATSREFHEVQELRGSVVILKEGESVEGILTLKKGRTISDYETETLEIFNPSKGLQLLPINVVIQSKIDSLNEKYGIDHHYIKLTNLGYRISKSGSKYTDWRLQIAETTQDELIALANFENSQA